MYKFLWTIINRLQNKRFFVIYFLITFIFPNNKFDYISYYTDQIGHSSYSFNIKNRSIMGDFFYENIFIDGIKKYPRSSYLIKTPDHLDWKNYFIYRQGDYIYRELNLGSNYELTDSLNIKVYAQSKTFPGEFGLLGPSESNFKDNILQNYIINLNSNKFDLGFMYHFENTGLPINNYDHNNRNCETIHLGIKNNGRINDIKYNFSYFIDTGSIETSQKINYLSELIIFEMHHSKDLLTYKIKSYNKNFISHVDSINNTKKNNLSYLKLNLIPNFFDNNVMLGLDLVSNDLIYTFSIFRKYKNLMINLYKENFYSDYIQGSDSSSTVSFKSENIILETFINAKKLNNNMKVIKNINRNKSKYYFTNNLEIDFSNYILSVSYYYDQSKDNFINQYINYNIHFAPNLIWTQRYKFSFDANYYSYSVSEKKHLNIDGIFYSSTLGDKMRDYFYNLKFGLLVENFKFTYNVNFISDDGFNISNSFLPINRIAFFQVDWMFND